MEKSLKQLFDHPLPPSLIVQEKEKKTDLCAFLSSSSKVEEMAQYAPDPRVDARLGHRHEERASNLDADGTVAASYSLQHCCVRKKEHKKKDD